MSQFDKPYFSNYFSNYSMENTLGEKENLNDNLSSDLNDALNTKDSMASFKEILQRSTDQTIQQGKNANELTKLSDKNSSNQTELTILHKQIRNTSENITKVLQ